MDVVVKWLGSVYDVRVFVNFSFNFVLKNEEIFLCRWYVLFDEDFILVFLLGDLVYLFMLYLMKEYFNGDLN